MYRIFKLLIDVVTEALQPPKANSNVQTEIITEIPSEYYERKEEYRSGKITDLYEDYGLVDGYIYFSKENVKTNVHLQVQEPVEVYAVRESRHTGWIAESVNVLNDEWDSVQEVYQAIGVITNLRSDGNGTIDYKYQFTAKCFKDYEPWRGDKIQMQILYNGTSQVIQRVEPFTIQEYTGKIVALGQHYCFIDGNLAFTRTCCTEGYIPRKGDLVVGTMIECDQGQRWKHRALTVSACTPASSQYSSANSQFVEQTSDGANPHYRRNVNEDYIFISGDLEFNDVPIGQIDTHTIFVRNGTKDALNLCSVTLGDCSGAQFILSEPKVLLEGRGAQASSHSSAQLCLFPGMTCYFTLTFTPRYVGADRQQLLITFDDVVKRQQIIGHCVGVVEEQAVENHASRHNYRQVRHNIQPTNDDHSVLPGVRPIFKASRLPKNLPQFDVPRVLRDCILTDTKRLDHQYPQLQHELCQQNYATKFSLLLHIEEINAEIEIRKFDVKEAVFNRSRGYLTLVLSGLPDGQPNLMVGDKLSVSVNSHIQPIEYEGYIHEIICDTIYAKFHASFHSSYNEEECYVVFHISRVPFRRMHQAVKMIHQTDWSGLFPKHVSVKPSVILGNMFEVGTDSLLMNKSLNREQSLGVRRVLEARCRPFPFVIFGPPGTGKTVTMVESVLQVFTKVRGSRILFCTPSNSAADLVTIQLVKSYNWSENNLVRLISYRRQEELLPEDIRKFCKDGSDLALIAQHRVIISTCVSAGMLLSLGLSTKHFSHVFIDEAGQASEPECLIPVSLVAANSEACIVLAGDHKQLGAIVKSQISDTCGLSISFLERLMLYQPYSKDSSQYKEHASYDPNLVTKLLRNYRSHPFILSLYSQLFYDNELIVSAGAEAYSLQDIDVLPNSGKPIIFHGLKGEELREGNNPSWFNAAEVVQVVKYLKASLELCKAEEIGVITPYRKQVEKLRQMMRCVGVDSEVKVGSVEEFQGQERRIIIVSTVRSRADSGDALGYNAPQLLGFLGNCKRFNVSISRAQALLIVVGNPFILSQDLYWRYLIDYCVSNGCYVGVPYKEQESQKS